MQRDDRDENERALGMGYGEGSDYITGNDDNSPDPPGALATDTDAKFDDAGVEGGEVNVEDALEVDEARLGLGGVTGTERFDENMRNAEIAGPEDAARTGAADFRTQQAVNEQYSKRQGEITEE